MVYSLQEARVPRDAEHQPVSGVFTRDVGTLCTNRSLLPFKGKTMENEGRTCFQRSSHVPPFQLFFLLLM